MLVGSQRSRRKIWRGYAREMCWNWTFQNQNSKRRRSRDFRENQNYWKFDEFGNKLPYLDAIRFSFMKEKKAELLEFKKGNLDMIFQLPLEMIDEVVGELEDAKQGGNKPFQMQVNSAFSVQYYGFQNKSELFSNADVRKAFNYAIDREKLVTFTLQGDGKPGIYGIVPPGLKGYEYDSLKGYSYNVEKAKEHFKNAGILMVLGFLKSRYNLIAVVLEIFNWLKLFKACYKSHLISL